MRYMEYIKEYGIEYLVDNNYDDDLPNDMSEFDDYFMTKTAKEIITMYNRSKDNFKITDNYFIYNPNSRTVRSITCLSDYLADIIREEDFVKWMLDKSIIDNENEID